MNVFLSESQGISLSKTPSIWSLTFNDKGYAVATGNRSFLSLASGQPTLSSSSEYIPINIQNSGAFSIGSANVLTASSASSLSVAPWTSSLDQHWRIVLASDPHQFTLPTWLGTSQPRSLANVPDGVYRIQHSQNKKILAVQNEADSHGIYAVQMITTEIEVRSLGLKERKLTIQSPQVSNYGTLKEIEIPYSSRPRKLI